MLYMLYKHYIGPSSDVAVAVALGYDQHNILKEVNSLNDIKDELRSRLGDYVSQVTTPSRRAGRNMFVCPLCGSGSKGGRDHHAFRRRWEHLHHDEYDLSNDDREEQRSLFSEASRSDQRLDHEAHVLSRQDRRFRRSERFFIVSCCRRMSQNVAFLCHFWHFVPQPVPQLGALDHLCHDLALALPTLCRQSF